MIRRLVTDDAEELTALLVANREFLAPYVPEQPESFLTVQAQRERIADAEHLYGILDDGVPAGTIALSNLAHGSFQSASLGYWVDEARNGRGLAAQGVAASRSPSASSAFTVSRRGRSSTTSPRNGCSRRATSLA